MASDLSLLIKEGITSTLETNISLNTSIYKTYKVNENSLQKQKIVCVNSSFAFEKFTTNLKFILPAYTSTMIAYAMLMESTPPSHEMDDDIADAIKELITQICGGLETAINGLNFNDLGKTKFSVSDFEVIDGTNYQTVHQLNLFKLEVQENKYDFYIDFDEAILPFLETINQSEVLEVEKVAEDSIDDNFDDLDIEGLSDDDDETEEDKINSIDTNQSEDTQEISLNDEPTDLVQPEVQGTSSDNSSEQEIKEDENIPDDTPTEELSDIDKKNKKLKLIIIIVAGVLGVIIVSFLIAFFMGAFDNEEPIVEDKNITKPSQQSIIIAEIKNKQIDFKLEMINEQRLNKRLSLLTKYEILEDDVLAKYTREEQERLYKIKMEKLDEFALNNKEESLFKNTTNEPTNKENRFDSNNTDQLNKNIIQENIDNEQLTFIKVDPLEFKNYKNIIDKEKQKSTQISICKNDDGKIEIYVGPLYVKLVINNIMNNAKKLNKNSDNHIRIISLKRKDFNQICDF